MNVKNNIQMNQNYKLFGSTLIIAGTTIGAGMLALPIASAGLGFIYSSLIMLGMWALMAYTALLMLEVHQHADTNATLHSLANQFLGRRGKIIATTAMLFLFYALCAAYIAGGGGQLALKFNAFSPVGISPAVGSILLTIIVAAIVSTGVKHADITNRILFTVKLILLVITFKLLAPQVAMDNLVHTPNNHLLIFSALPIIFTSFGFHGSIPSIVRYLDVSPIKLRKVILVGSALPLVIYLIWQWSTQGTLTTEQLLNSHQLDAFLPMLSASSQSNWLSPALQSFADLALLTSFIGVSLGLFDFIRDMLGNPSRSTSAVVTFMPPLTFAIFYPQGFIIALGYASLALVVLAIFLPVAMAYKARQRQDQHFNNHTMKLDLPSHGQVTLTAVNNITANFGLVAASCLGIVIILAQCAQMFGLIPSMG